MRGVLCLLLCLCLYTTSKAQNEHSTQIKLPADYLFQVSGKLDDLSDKLDKKSEKALSQLQKQEERIRRKLSRLDSSKTKQVRSDSQWRG
jgi:Skp family chaperone for outer membrane proteins